MTLADAQVRRGGGLESGQSAGSRADPEPQMSVSRQVRTYVDGALVEESQARPLRAEDAAVRRQDDRGSAEPGERLSSTPAPATPPSAAPAPVTGAHATDPLPVPPGFEVIDFHPFRTDDEPEEPSADEQVEEAEVPLWQRASTPHRNLGGGRGRRTVSARADAEAAPAASGDLAAPKKPLMHPSPHLIVGEIISVDAEYGTAVLWLKSRHIFIDETVTSRDFSLQTTARLAPAQQRLGRAQGLVVVEGMPRRGDEVVLSVRDTE